MSDGEWNFAHLPTAALYDNRLKDSDRIILAKIIDLGWYNSPGDPETAPFLWQELAKIFDVGKTRYFEAIKILVAAGYIEVKKKPNSRISIAASSQFRNGEPSSSLTDSIKELQSLSDSRRSSASSETRTEIFDELLKAGIGEPLRSDLSEDPEIDLDYVRSHVRYAALRKDPTRYLANRLRSREPVPSAADFAKIDPDGEEARSRYAEALDEER
jgi:hypothetical protein